MEAIFRIKIILFGEENMEYMACVKFFFSFVWCVGFLGHLTHTPCVLIYYFHYIMLKH